MKDTKKSIDWDEVKARIKTAGDAIASSYASEELRKKAMKARTARFAEPTEEARTEAGIDAVEFVLASERYAVESGFVSEICPLSELTVVPCTPEFVLGIINVRGKILSVIDIKKFFGLPEKGITDLNKVIILNHQGMEFGLIADAIIGVKRIREADVEAPMPTLTGIRVEYLRGVTAGRVVIIDAKKLLADKGIIVEQNVEE